MRNIIVIGRNTLDDFITLTKIGEWFASERGRLDIQHSLDYGNYDAYDMSTRPEMGDALDAIDENTGMVIALHIYGIDQLPGRPPLYGMDQPYTYSKRNGELLQMCMDKKIPLVCWGDQPWMGLQQKIQIHENSLWIYEISA